MAREITVKKALHHHKKEMPCNYDLNTYRGCATGCTYCFAKYSHQYIDGGDFFDDICVKTNVAEALDSELSKKSWKGEPIKIGGVTDSYQPVEEQYKLMPNVLEVLIKHRNPVLIATKSNLILRDFSLIEKLAGLTEVAIASTITTVNEDVQQKIEPLASSSLDRFEMLQQFGKAGCYTTVLCTPIIPFLTDGIKNLDSLFRLTKENNINSILTWTLHLRGSTKDTFYRFLMQNYPNVFPKLKKLYISSNAVSHYKKSLNQMVLELREKYNLFDVFKPTLFPQEEKQLSLI